MHHEVGLTQSQRWADSTGLHIIASVRSAKAVRTKWAENAAGSHSDVLRFAAYPVALRPIHPKGRMMPYTAPLPGKRSGVQSWRGDDDIVFAIQRGGFLMLDINASLTTTPTTSVYYSKPGDSTFTAPSETDCFAGGHAAGNGNGLGPIEDLPIGDLVMIRENGLQPVR